MTKRLWFSDNLRCYWAIVDGCTVVGAFAKTVLPLSLPAILTVIIFAFTLTMQEFVYALTFISSSDEKDRSHSRRYLLLGRTHGGRADCQRAGCDCVQSFPRSIYQRHHGRGGEITGGLLSKQAL